MLPPTRTTRRSGKEVGKLGFSIRPARGQPAVAAFAAGRPVDRFAKNRGAPGTSSSHTMEMIWCGDDEAVIWERGGVVRNRHRKSAHGFMESGGRLDSRPSCSTPDVNRHFDEPKAFFNDLWPDDASQRALPAQTAWFWICRLKPGERAALSVARGYIGPRTKILWGRRLNRTRRLLPPAPPKATKAGIAAPAELCGGKRKKTGGKKRRGKKPEKNRKRQILRGRPKRAQRILRFCSCEK